MRKKKKALKVANLFSPQKQTAKRGQSLTFIIHFNMLKEIVEKFSSKAEIAIDVFKKAVILTFMIILCFTFLTAISTFIYGSFYYAFVPAPQIKDHLYPQFTPCEERPEKCSFLNASAQLQGTVLNLNTYFRAYI